MCVCVLSSEQMCGEHNKHEVVLSTIEYYKDTNTMSCMDVGVDL